MFFLFPEALLLVWEVFFCIRFATNGPYRIPTSNFFFENVVQLPFIAEKLLSDRWKKSHLRRFVVATVIFTCGSKSQTCLNFEAKKEIFKSQRRTDIFTGHIARNGNEYTGLGKKIKSVCINVAN